VKFSILSIGTELNLGLILNTNSKYIAETLTELGLENNYMLTVRDDIRDISNALKICIKNSDIVIISGGLGPTDDDVTREAVADFLSEKLIRLEELDKTSLKFLKFIKNDEIIQNLKRQSFIPESCIPIRPRVGSASGFIVDKDEKLIFSIPGVPREMKDMFDHDVISYIKNYLKARGYGKAQDSVNEAGTSKNLFTKKTVLLSTDISESQMEFSIRDIKPHAKDLNVEIGVTANPGLIKIMLIARSASAKKCEKNLKVIEAMIREVIGEHIYWKGDGAIGDSIGKAIKDSGRSITLATAESITGGLISSLITDTPGSSEYFKGSIVSYSIFSKSDILGVNKETIDEEGAVSSKVCLEMAKRAKTIFNSDFSISATGIAGPTSPQEGKVIGMVYAGIAGPDNYSAIYEKQFIGTRADIKFRTAQFILNRLRLAILNENLNA
jgi:competence/damage-inducible protein CinA C-terminal domain